MKRGGPESNDLTAGVEDTTPHNATPGFYLNGRRAFARGVFGLLCSGPYFTEGQHVCDIYFEESEQIMERVPISEMQIDIEAPFVPLPTLKSHVKTAKSGAELLHNIFSAYTARPFLGVERKESPGQFKWLSYAPRVSCLISIPRLLTSVFNFLFL